MTPIEPTQPLTDAELETIRKDVESNTPAYASVTRAILLAEVDRLRAALTALGRNERAAADRALTLQDENSALLRKLEDQYRHRAQRANEITRLRSENASARELHEPSRSSAWGYIYCASGCGAGPLQGPDPFPCNTAKALGMSLDQSGEGQANG